MTRSPFYQLVMANIRSYLRQPEAIFWTYGFPLIMVVGLGLAFNTDAEERIPFLVADTAASEPAITKLMDDARFDIDVRPLDEGMERIRRNQSVLLVDVASASGVDDVGGADAAGGMRYIYDPTNPDAVATRALVDDAVQRAAGRQDALAIEEDHTDAPGSRYVDFLVPGLIGMNLMGAGLWGIGFSTVDLRVKNLLKRMVATPMRRSHFLLALVGSRIVFFIPEMMFLLLAARLLFGVPVVGSYLDIVIIALFGSITFAGVGLLIAARARTIEGVSGLMNLVMIPMWLGSGIFFSSERFPDIAQPLIQALPLTQVINALRAVMLSGESLFAQGTALGILALWCVGSYMIALKAFRWV